MKFSALILCIQMLVGTLHAGQMDSVRMESRGGKEYIVHRVEAKETLFAISRKYNVRVSDILTVNPDAKEGLKIDQEILVPLVAQKVIQTRDFNGNEVFHVIKAQETFYGISKEYGVSIDSLMSMNKLTSTDLSLGDSLVVGYKEVTKLDKEIVESDENDAPIIEPKQEKTDSVPELKYHIVEPSETYFSVAKLYEITVDELKAANNIDNDTLSIGQKLIIPERIELAGTGSTEIEPIPIDTVFVSTSNERFQDRVEKMGSLDKQVQEGFAMKIHHTEDTRKYLALHREAPIGSVIEVKNKMNDRSIFAKVVGKLPETGINRNVLIRISNAAYEGLKALDGRIPVEIGYILEND